MDSRSPTADERRLLRALAEIAHLEDPESWMATLGVRHIDDGGMGSLEIVAPSSRRAGSATTVCLAAVQFTDSDGVEVIASLYADERGVPFELDVWKTDISLLRCIPERFRPLDE